MMSKIQPIETAKRSSRSRVAFTIVEVLIALTVTLLILLAVTRTFKTLGQRITASQSELQLSADLRDVADRLRRELDASVRPNPGSPEGYLVYHEGQMTDGTMSHLTLARFDAIGNGSSATDFFPTNRYGDLDDYLAFTCRASQMVDNNDEPIDEPFMGYLPRGILAAQAYVELWDKLGTAPTYAAFNAAYADVAVYNEATSAELVPFYSDLAEIAYWLSPQWNGTAAGGQVIYRDADGDLLPDRMRLHRRVMLIREDLNMSLTDIAAHNPAFTIPAGRDTLETIPFLAVDTSSGTPVLSLLPMSSANAIAGNCVNYWDGNQGDPAGWIDAPGNWYDPGLDARSDPTVDFPNWLVGVARVQQVMDLSLSRVTNDAPWTAAQAAGVIATGTSFGMPSRLLKANSIAELTRPENRFAYVRMPRALLAGGTSIGSTMPALALAPPPPFMVTGERIWDGTDPEGDGSGFFDYGARIVRDLPASADPDGSSGASTFGAHFGDTEYSDPTSFNVFDFYSQRFGKFTLTGFLRPEFGLADIASGPSTVGTGTQTSRIGRARTDVVANDVLAFDLKIYDPQTPIYTWLGTDGVEGGAGDDDGDGDSSDGNTVYDPDELGFAGSDDEIVRLTDLNIRRAITSSPAVATVAPFQPLSADGFVDLFSPRLAGHPMGSIADPAVTRADLNFLGLANAAAERPLMGIGDIYTAQFKPFPLDFYASGKFIINDIGGTPPLVNSFYQPQYDTWTTTYDGDGFNQEAPLPALLSRFYTQQYVEPSLAPVEQVIDVPVTTRVWTATAEGGNTPPTADAATGQVDFSAGTPVQVTAPVNSPLQGLRVEIRLYDRGVGRVRQQSVIADLP